MASIGRSLAMAGIAVCAPMLAACGGSDDPPQDKVRLSGMDIEQIDSMCFLSDDYDNVDGRFAKLDEDTVRIIKEAFDQVETGHLNSEAAACGIIGVELDEVGF